MRKAGGYSRAENEADAERMARMLRAIDACPKPVIALAHGAAIGGGVGLVAAADIAIAAEGTVFSLAEVKLGILPAVISPYVLRAIGPRVRARPVPDGRPLRRAGGPPDRPRAPGRRRPASSRRRARRKVASLLSSGPEAVRVAKRLIEQVAGKTPEEAMALTVRTIAERRASAEAKEGLTAFLEKRKPSWAEEIEEMKGTQRRMDCPEVRQGLLRVAAGRASGRPGEVLLLRAPVRGRGRAAQAGRAAPPSPPRPAPAPGSAPSAAGRTAEERVVRTASSAAALALASAAAARVLAQDAAAARSSG